MGELSEIFAITWILGRAGIEDPTRKLDAEVNALHAHTIRNISEAPMPTYSIIKEGDFLRG
jgi:hypothetical protein